MKAGVAFGLAAACLGAGIAFVQMGVAAMISEKADESWERVTSEKVTDGARTIGD
jgi:hypothetical protein